MAIPEDSINKLHFTKVGQTTFVRLINIKYGIDVTFYSNEKRTLIIHKTGIKILPSIDEDTLQNFYFENYEVVEPVNDGTLANILQKFAENKLFQ